MKNGLLIWNILLTIGLGFLLIKNFSSGSSTTKIKSSSKDSVTSDGNFTIAYFEMDSIATHFSLVKELKDEMQKRESNINNELDKMDRTYRQKVNDFQQRAQGMTQAQQEKETQELLKLQDDMKNKKMSLDQDYNDFVIRKQDEIKSKIQDFLKEYNKIHNYTYIVSYEQGLFYYKDTAYNITSDLLAGLNNLYKKK